MFTIPSFFLEEMYFHYKIICKYDAHIYFEVEQVVLT